jgi:hypothetical protein
MSRGELLSSMECIVAFNMKLLMFKVYAI